MISGPGLHGASATSVAIARQNDKLRQEQESEIEKRAEKYRMEKQREKEERKERRERRDRDRCIQREMNKQKLEMSAMRRRLRDELQGRQVCLYILLLLV